MEPIDPSKLSLDYLLENKVITILSWDYVIEHGKDYSRDEVEEFTWDGRDYMCYPDMYLNGLFSGVLYEVAYMDVRLLYYKYYKDGLRNGADVEFYDSGKVKTYCVWKNNRIVGKLYEWYEDGKIKEVVDYTQNTHIEFDEQGNITEQGKRKKRNDVRKCPLKKASGAQQMLTAALPVRVVYMKCGDCYIFLY